MHPGNREFLTYLSKTYPEFFVRSRVLELGSLNINGTVRDHFTDPVEYIGIDLGPGRDVDLVVRAKDTVFEPDHFDIVISMSMVEHDPDWRESLGNNFQWLRSGGIFILCWGAEGNLHHGPEPWKPVPFKEMEDFLRTQPLRDLDCFVEGTRYSDVGGVGAADAVAWKI